MSDLFGGSDTNINVPGMSSEEKDLLSLQTELLLEQRDITQESLKTQELLMPLIYSELGLTPQYEDRTQYTEGFDYTDIGGEDLRFDRDEIVNQQTHDVLVEAFGKDYKGLANKRGYGEIFKKNVQSIRDQIGAKFDKKYDPSLRGEPETLQELIGFERTPEEDIELSPEDQLRKEIEMMQLERSKAALEGNLEVNPALLKDLAEQEETLRDQLRRNLGTGYETSTPGIEALGEFGENKANILEGARRGDLSLMEQLSLARGQTNTAQKSNTLANLYGIAPSNMGLASGYSNVIQGAGSPLSAYMNQRNLQFQANATNAQNQASTLGAIYGAGGFALGSWLGKDG